mmetsp:Transcript_48369/g.103691  ORF Transcript_48369/g.103691 Transcript_48369/m.103691 type:complete len:270 (-) Transcript_48369:72-881(-)
MVPLSCLTMAEEERSGKAFGAVATVPAASLLHRLPPSPARARRGPDAATLALPALPAPAPLRRAHSSPAAGGRGAEAEGLEALDWSVGLLAPYLVVLRERFGNPAEIVERYVGKDEDGKLSLDPSFFDDLGVSNLHHRALFKAWFLRPLKAEALEAAEAPEVSVRRRSARSATPRRRRPSVIARGAESIRRWLEQIDHGRGALARAYSEAIAGRFGSAKAVVEAYTLASGGLSPELFQDFSVTKIGHRRLFQRWFADVGPGYWRQGATS